MPYIKYDRRVALDERFYHDADPVPAADPGELNFQITQVCLNYLNYYGIRYGILNDIIGALECAKQEFYRRMAAPYETKKMEENGDVYN